MQILSNNAVATGVGVYWMFYSGASFEDVEAPEGLPGLQAHDSIEGLRYASNKNRQDEDFEQDKAEDVQRPFRSPLPCDFFFDSRLQTFHGPGAKYQHAQARILL